MIYEKYIQDLLKFVKKNISIDTKNINNKQVIIGSIISYIVLFSIYKPNQIIEFVKSPLIQIMILVSIFYIYKYDPIISIGVIVAFILTISTPLDTKDVNYIPIIKTTEGFQNNTKGKKKIENDDEDDDEDEDDDDSSDEDDSSEEEDSSDEEESDREDSDNEDEDDDDVTEGFSSKNIISRNSINDTFKNLHNAIHKLENFINVKDN
tara:strand:+ start:703 stop:1326 length:624 start_codon:yes stop_codon:yes gene_type:complete